MAGCPDDLPGVRDKVTLATALDLVTACADLLDPSADLYLDHGFETWEERFIAWRECTLASDCACHLDFLRYALEDVAAVEPQGANVLDALKLGLSAFVLARENPYHAVVDGEWNADTDPILRRAIDLYRKRPEGMVALEYKPESMARLAENGRQEWLGDLIARAHTGKE